MRICFPTSRAPRLLTGLRPARGPFEATRRGLHSGAVRGRHCAVGKHAAATMSAPSFARTRPVSPVLISTMAPGGNELACAPRPEQEKLRRRHEEQWHAANRRSLRRLARGASSWQAQKLAGAVSGARHGRIALTGSTTAIAQSRYPAKLIPVDPRRPSQLMRLTSNFFEDFTPVS